MTFYYLFENDSFLNNKHYTKFVCLTQSDIALESNFLTLIKIASSGKHNFLSNFYFLIWMLAQRHYLISLSYLKRFT